LHDTAISSHRFSEQLYIVNGHHQREWNTESKAKLPNGSGSFIAYNFFVGTDGSTVQTRLLPPKEEGLHTWCVKTDKFPQCEDDENWLNRNSIAIVLAGSFSDARKEYPSKAQFKSFKLLLLALQREYGIADDHIILHADAQFTTCPGIDLHPRNWKALEKLI
jgi:hypothetical protein